MIAGLASLIFSPMSKLPLTQPPSSSVGDYLKAIWEIGGSGAASTSDVATRLLVSSASVTNMFGRLQEMGLVRYERYRGASLTRRGRGEALRLVRRHRLIETFLLEHLGYSWQDVHEEAERLEHVVSDEFTERLAEFLEHPGYDPHGAPIPAANGALAPDGSHPLREAEAGDRIRISRINHEKSSVLAYLGERGIFHGKVFEVKEVRDLDGVVTVEDEEGEIHSLGELLTGSILVQSLPRSEE